MTIFTDTNLRQGREDKESLRTALNCGKLTKVCFAFTIKSQLALTDIYSSIQIMDHKLEQKTRHGGKMGGEREKEEGKLRQYPYQHHASE